MQKLITVWVITLSGMLFIGTAFAADWGHLSATFAYDGPPPTAKKVSITSDKQFCGKFNVVDESLVVNADNGGVANVIVYMYVGRGGKKPPIHESYAATEAAKVILDNKHCRFDPHVVLLRTTQTLVAGNTDAIGHNTNFTTFRNKAHNTLIPAGGKEELRFPLEEPLPVPVACNIHPWMKGYLVVKDHPYMGASDPNGELTIKNIPAGEWTFQLWHEKAGYLREVKVNGTPTEWKRGRLTIDIKPGENNLGDVRIPASMFE